MTTKVPDHSSGDVLIELYGPENGGWYSSRIHDWICVSDLRDPDTRGYLVLRALVYEKYKKPVRNLTLAILCELIPGPNGKPSSPTRVRDILKALSAIGLISTPEGGPITTSSRASAAQKPLRIRINDMPREGYGGWRNVEAKLQWLQNGKPIVGAGRNSDPGPEPVVSEEDAGRNSDPTGQDSDPDSEDDLREREHPLVPSLGEDDAPFGGVPPVDGRSPSPTGSTRAREEGDFVASDNDSPLDLPQHDYADAPVGGKSGSSRKARHTRAQLDMVRQVRVFFPPELEVPEIPVVSQAVLDALAGDVPFSERTPEQLGARIRQRWVDHGFAAKFYAGEIGKPAGVAVALVRPLKGSDRYGCADPRCEAGVNVDTGEVCVPCSERIAERKAARRQERAQAAANGAGTPSVDSSAAVAPEGPSLPAPRAMVEWWHCANESCDVTGKVPAPADGVCPTCRDKEALAAEVAEAAFVPRPVPQVDLPPAEREPDERTLRLQAKIAARFGTTEQQGLYCEAQQSPEPAPF